MKKVFLICLAVFGFAFAANAQEPTTKAVPISNGCGSESSTVSRVLSPMGTVVKAAKETSNRSYQEAQKDRERSKQLQPTWEKENQQCLDGNNYRVTPNK